MGVNMGKKKRVILIFCVALIATFIYLSNNYVLNLTPSQPLGFYQKLPFKGSIKRGELVLFTPTKQAMDYIKKNKLMKENNLLLKNVGAISGDKVIISKEKLIINGQYIGEIYQKNSQGKPLPKLRGEVIILSKEFFPLGQNDQSFDGRYYGTVPINLIKFKAKPAWLF